MSSDTSPPSRYRLDNPGRTAGAPGGAVPRRQVTAAPSWITVIGTTLRLWVRRRVLHVPDTGRIGRARRAGVTAFIVVVVVAAGVAAGVALTGALGSPRARDQTVTAPKLTPAQKQARAAAAAQAAANGTAAASWIADQVSQQAVIGCDPATCAAILAAGYASGGQVVLQPGVTLPTAGALVVATPAVRAQYRTQLAAAAPAVIAAFGTGPEAVQVRVVVSGGQTAYSQAASSEVAARRTAGLRLMANGRVHVRAAAREDLADGLVDPRLIAVLRTVAAHYRVFINHFADAGPLADSSVPYRLALIVGLTSTHAPRQESELAAVLKLLQQQPSGYRAALTVIPVSGGENDLKIQFPAPSPG